MRAPGRSLAALRLLLVLLLAPLALGLLTVTYRDASATHLPGKIVTAGLIRSGVFPHLHPALSCGEPLAGNPNFATFLPDTLLYLVLPASSAFGLHFALAAALAWFGARRLARRLGASRSASEIAAIAFVLSGPFLSAWIFYNSGMALALAPGLAAAAAKLGGRAAEGNVRRSLRALAEAALWGAAEIVAGEPVVALLSLLAAAAALLAILDRPRSSRPFRPLAAALALAGGAILALALAAPQIATAWQIQKGSSRDLARYDFLDATLTSVHPARLLEQVLPFPFGRPDLGGEGRFEGWEVTGGNIPYLWTLHLGWISLLLLAAFGRLARGERIWWGVGGMALLLSFGRFLPGAEWLHPFLSVGGRIRLPIKWWYLVAIAMIPLVAASADRRLRGDPPRRRSVFVLFLLLLAGVVTATIRRGPTPLEALALALSAGAALTFQLPLAGDRLRREGLPLLIALPLAISLLPLLLCAVDRPPLIEPFEAGGRILSRVRMTPHPPPWAPEPPERTTRATFRRSWTELWATSGAARGVRYAFDFDPDGSYSNLDRIARETLDQLPWQEREVELRLAGVDRIVTGERLPSPPFHRVESLPGPHGIALWRLDSPPVPGVRFATRLFHRPDPAAVVLAHRDARFDPSTDTILLGSTHAPDGTPLPARVTVRSETPTTVIAEVDAGGEGVLVWSRTWIPAWRAKIDDAPAAPLVADGHLTGVAVPAGRHRVTIEWNPRPLAIGTAFALLALFVSIALLAGFRDSSPS
jgi:hypothetical protein